MTFDRCDMDGVVIVTPKVWGDNRGYFFESFRSDEFRKALGCGDFVQENQSKSQYGVVRGLHFQRGAAAQAKLVRAVQGCIRDVIVDLRSTSATFGRWAAFELSDTNHRQLYIPRGFAHGFSVLSETAVIQYKCDNYYSPLDEDGVAWNDPQLGIDWQIPSQSIILSDKDRAHPSMSECYKF